MNTLASTPLTTLINQPISELSPALKQELQQALPQALEQICYEASDAIMAVYEQQTVTIQHKQDNSPVTEADLAAHHIIAQGLAALTPNIPLLSEEGTQIPVSERLAWETFWCVDPVDGTKEFIAQTGEFTVNIALIKQGKPVFGMICQPVDKTLWWGGEGLGSWKKQGAWKKQASWNKQNSGVAQPIQVRPLSNHLTVIASRRHGQERNQTILAKLKEDFSQLHFEDCGSSLKMCRIAEGNADLYPRCYPTCEWDTAAAQAIVEGAGGQLVNAHSLKPLSYNQRDTLVNPYFYVIGDPEFPLHKLQTPLAESHT